MCNFLEKCKVLISNADDPVSNRKNYVASPKAAMPIVQSPWQLIVTGFYLSPKTLTHN